MGKVVKSRADKAVLNQLEKRIGHTFSDTSLLECALTHASALGSNVPPEKSYQRLEFLGDRVLGLAIAAMLHDTFKTADEGELARRFNQLVKRETCAEVAQELDLGAAMIVGTSEDQAGGRKKTALLADICEAVLAAIYIDAGYDKVTAFIQQHWKSRMMASSGPLRDAKTTLQEWAQAKGLPTPVYQVRERTGPDHAPLFKIEVSVEGIVAGLGTGNSKRHAEQSAAEQILRREKVWAET
ncbi:MAG: ribonuclease III [Stappiaceae bacterium]